MLKFVHAADLHLDSQMRNLSRYHGAPLDALRGATRRALENLVDLCIDQQAGALLIAGDVYDGDWQDYNTGLFFNQQMTRLGRAGVRVVLVSGNHDAQSVISRKLTLADHVRTLSTRRPETVDFADLKLAVHGRGYGRRDVTDNLAADYPPPLPDRYNVGLLHTALDGREGHDRYAPCREEELIAKGYDYWALGHVHRREVICREPWIIFPGNLQGRHARETGPKGATVVTLDAGERVADAVHHDLDVLRWAQCEVAVDAAAGIDDVLALTQTALDHCVGDAAGRPLAVRLRLSGVCRDQSALIADQERWRNELRAAAGEVSDELWLEKIQFDTQSPLDLDALASGDDPLAGLLRSLRSLRETPEQLARLADELRDQIKLPSAYRSLDDALDPQRPEVLAPLLADVEQLLLSQLLRGAK